jgi:hypothetical protein
VGKPEGHFQRVAQTVGEKIVAKRKVNKSQRILDYCAEHPDAKPKEVAATLNKSEKLNISAQYVSTIRSKHRGVVGGGSMATRRRVDLHNLIEAKKFVDRVGGLKAAQDAINAIAQLQ